MQQHRFLFIIPAVLLSLIISASAGAAEIPLQSNETVRHAQPAAQSPAAEDYYTDRFAYRELESLPGAADASTGYTAMQENPLFDRLHELMTVSHTKLTTYSGYKQGSLAYYWPYTDTQSGVDSYLMFYSDVPGNSEGVSLNREHLWPKSRASYNEKNGGADLHHLRPAVDSLNRAKSDHLFGYISGTYSAGFTEGSVLGSICYRVHQKDDLFECKDDVKGDVARILLYVYCRWEQPNLYTDIPQELLPALDPDDKTDNGGKAIESLDTLLQWCENDPVDAWEMRRNDLVQEIQGNRNVFIDYPELAWQLFGRDLPAGLTTPSRQGCAHHFIETERHEAACLRDGSFTIQCEHCGNTQERRLAAPGHFDGDKDGRCDRCGRVPGAVLLGDADGDGAVTPLDGTLIQRYFAGMAADDEVFFDAAAVSGDDFDVTDATLIGQYLAEIATPYPIGEVIG